MNWSEISHCPDIKKARLSLKSLSIYRNLLKDKVICKLNALLDYIDGGEIDLSKSVGLYNNFFFELAACSSITCLKEYMVDKILYDDNPFSRQAEALDFGSIDSTVKAAARNDLSYLYTVSQLSSAYVKSHMLMSSGASGFEKEIIENLPEWWPDNSAALEIQSQSCCHESIRRLFLLSRDWRECIQHLSEFHKKWGCGIFARYKAFVWEHQGGEGYLRGVENPDPITLSDLIGYEAERSEVINNTLQLLDGFPANNVLLYGDRGTGKSSTVKAILNEYYTQGLRIVEVPKKYLIDFPDIIRKLEGRKQKFIIFCDDLTFGDNEENYTALKAALEGGLENRPRNVVVYATSNRRHLIKENFSDRAGLHSGNRDDEIRSQDTMQEKLSLADRFGITVVFSSPDKSKYLEIVEGLAAKRGLKVDKEYLHKEAMKWELWYNGRSPRTARQFIDWLQWRGSHVH